MSSSDNIICNPEDINQIAVSDTTIQRVWNKGKETEF